MSQSIAFIGVGNMGCPMAENLNVNEFNLSAGELD